MKDFLKWVQKKKKNHKKLLQQLKKDTPHALVPIVLCVVLIVLTRVDLSVRQDIRTSEVERDFTYAPVQLYPVLQQSLTPNITAQAAIILDDASQVPVFEKNQTLRFSMASTTKIMTALVALDHYQNDDLITIYLSGVEGAVVGFSPGEKLRFEDMIYAMLLPSGNDAAYAIAQNYPGGMSAFVAKMNDKAVELGLSDTHFADAAGLLDDDNFTTVKDLARITSVALKNPLFAEVVATKRIVIRNTAGKQYVLINLNRLLGQQGVTGVKTGTTEGAGEVLVTSKVENGKTFIVIVMRSQDRFADTQTLLSIISNNVTYIDPLYTLLRNEKSATKTTRPQ